MNFMNIRTVLIINVNFIVSNNNDGLSKRLQRMWLALRVDQNPFVDIRSKANKQANK